MPNAHACDTAVVVDTWVQDPGKSTGQIVVRQFCPLAGPAAVPVVDAKPVPVVEAKSVEVKPVVKAEVIAPLPDTVRTVRFAEDSDVVLIYEGNVLREVRMYPRIKGVSK
jgi:hypothetical protein